MAGRINVQIASGISAIVVNRETRLAEWWIREPAANQPGNGRSHDHAGGEHLR
jgi:hypothetical protein